MPDSPETPLQEDKSRRMFDGDRAVADPPKVQTNRGKVVTLIACGTILAVLLIVVVLNIDTGTEIETPDVVVDDIPELIPPPLTDEETRATGRDLDRSISVDLPEGGMIEVADDQGALAQEYRFARLNPRPVGKPEGWVEMVEPFAVIYGSKGQMMTLSGDVALAKVPERALESGTITGNVVIRVFESEPGVRFVEGEIEPSAVIETDEATFDNLIGEVRCAGHVDIRSTTVDLLGTGLRLQINDRDDVAHLWEIDVIRYILFHASPSADDAQSRERVAATDALPPAGAAPGGEQRDDEAPAAGRAQASPRVKSLDEVQFYRLTLRDNVRVAQDDPSIGRVATGHELTVVFSFESEGLGDLVALGPRRTAPAAGEPSSAAPMTREAWLASLAVASLNQSDMPEISDGETLITCDGPLRMVPLEELAERPATANDARVSLTGSPGSPVVLRDLAAEAEARGGSFIYTTENGRIQLTRTAEQPVQFESPDYRAEGEHLWIDQMAHEGSFEGPGWLASVHREPEAVAMNAAANDPPPRNPVERLRVTWRGGVHLDFAETGEGQAVGPLTKATFNDEVRVRGDEGMIDCRDLELAFRQNDDDETVPASMTATGDAKLRSLQPLDAARADQGPQTIWADNVRVTFIESVPGAEAATANETAASANPFGDGTEVETLHAEGDVQVLLADGTRVFADTLDGNARQEEVTLLGENIVFVSGSMLIERGTKVHMVKSEGSADWPGPGMARIFTEPIDVAADRRIERPVLANDDADNPRQVRARWEKSMRYEGSFNDGAGRLMLAGNVDAVSTPSPLETATMTGETVELQFVDDGGESAAAPGEVDPLDSENRTLGKLIATGDARIESRRQYEDHPELKPRVFYIAGNHIEYDGRTFEALVDGAGDLLVRDLLPAPEGTTTREVPFSGKGTTGFKWTHRFEMKHIVDDYYEFTMTGDVTGMHVDLDDRPSHITGHTLVAGARRTEVTSQRDEGANEGALLVGSGLDLQKVSGEGGVFVRTETRDVSCNEFEYSLLTNMAHARAAAGGRVTVKTRGEVDPVFAQRIDWNLATDRIEVLRAGGSTPP